MLKCVRRDDCASFSFSFAQYSTFRGKNIARHASLNQILNISFVNVSLPKNFVWSQDASVILPEKWSSTKDHPIGSSQGVNNTKKLKFQYNMSHTC